MSIIGNNTAAISSIAASGGISKDEFFATGGQTTFNLSFVMQSSTSVFVNGSIISSTEYSGNGTNSLTFNNPLYENDFIVVISSTMASGGVTKQEFTAADGQSDFNLSFTMQASTAVFVNGNVIGSTEYTGVGTNTLSFNTPLHLNDFVVVIK